MLNKQAQQNNRLSGVTYGEIHVQVPPSLFVDPAVSSCAPAHWSFNKKEEEGDSEEGEGKRSRKKTGGKAAQRAYIKK